MMRGVKAGGDRQTLHEVIRGHSMTVSQAMAEAGAANDLLQRLAADPAFQTLRLSVTADELDPSAYVGRAPEQVDEFLNQVIPDMMREIEAVTPAAARQISV